MKKKIVWMVLSCLMVLSLVLASCAPAAPPEEKAAPPVKEVAPPVKEAAPPVKEVAPPVKEKEMVKDSLGRLVEEPQYGESINFVYGKTIYSFDPLTNPSNTQLLHLTNERLLMANLTKGPNGTQEWMGMHNAFHAWPVMIGHLAESWELVDPVTIVFHIRKGVHYALNPDSEASRLVNGREVTADDVVSCAKRTWENPRGNMYQTRGGALASATAPDKYTVIVKSPSTTQTPQLLEAITQNIVIYPPEVYEKYGDMIDWRNSVGSGPFMLVDYVPSSIATLVRNPNWWFHDPFFPENQLPYLDKVRWLFIMDASTRLAALRTGKVDQMGGEPETSLSWEGAANLMKTNPELKWAKYLQANMDILFMKFGTKPFDDIRVRRALSMAIDHQGMLRDLYGGNAEIFAYPVMPTPDWADMYTPLEQLPQSSRELYEYHPDKAKQLLAEAGYPNGFATSVVTTTAKGDLVSLIASYWDKIGVDTTIDVKESAILTSLIGSRTYKQMVMSNANAASIWQLLTTRVGTAQSRTNPGAVADPKTDEAFDQMFESYFDQPKRNQILKDIAVYIAGQCYFLPLPGVYMYTFWQPWVKGYNGEYIWAYTGRNAWPAYAWVDQELKKSILGR